MNIFAQVRDVIREALAALYPELPAEALQRVQVETPRDASHGDIATNAALMLAKPLGRKPQEVGAALAERLAAHPDIAKASVAGPGFVNLTMRPAALRARLRDILAAGRAYGDSAIGAGQRVNVEYVSANPTGPMHVGHCRGAVVGDALANLLAKAGYAVAKEYYVNDAGAQVDSLAWAAYWRYCEAAQFTLPESEIALMAGKELEYRGAYLQPVGEALLRAHGTDMLPQHRPSVVAVIQHHHQTTPAAEAAYREWHFGEHLAVRRAWLDTVRKTAVDAMMATIREDLIALGVAHDVFVSERALVESGAVQRTLDDLAARDLVYTGVLEPPKGKTPEDWEPRPQTLFRATLFGDEVDRPLRKSDGHFTYFASDIAYHADKIGRGFTRLVNVWGADHGGYVKRMQAAVQAVGHGKAALDVRLCQLVHLLKGGQPYRMSKRAGTFVTLRDLIDEVGKDVVRFIMLTRKNDAQMEFDLDKAVEQTRDNPVFYVQYAHARCRSVLRLAGESMGAAALEPAALAGADLDLLSDEAEMALIRLLIAWPRTVEAAADAAEPHRIAFFLYDVASAFHGLWTKGKDQAALRFIVPGDDAQTQARMALVTASANVIASGLMVMGVTPVEEMR
ncbi:MAG: arginine--tRNA ligase [Alphaproteobacteria bacterium]|nr:arginine--tRNA ligase [Alphaproteobacteria bacterium]